MRNLVKKFKKNVWRQSDFSSWYADPQEVSAGREVLVYPIFRSLMVNRLFMDAYSSARLGALDQTSRVLKENIPWLRRALWAPAVIEANDRYYLFLRRERYQNNSEIGGIGVAVAEQSGRSLSKMCWASP